MIRRSAFIAVAAVALMGLAIPAHAARGGNKGAPTRADATADTGTVFQLDQSAPSQGDTITFTVSTSETDRPFSKVNCYRDGYHVYHSSAGHFDDYYYYFGAPDHLLASLNWMSGAADCTASLEYMAKNGRMRTLASFDFHVTG